MTKFFIRYASSSWNAKDANGLHICRMEYGEMRSVYADKACNYSYREFWF